MKKNVLVSLALVSLAATTLWAAPFKAPGLGVEGSKHDINFYIDNIGGATGTKDTQERLCAFCHAPHHAFDPAAEGAADYMPLWSHQLNRDGFTPYASDTLDANIGDPLIGPSRLCMSCHDGVIAYDAHYSNDKTGAVLTGDEWSTPASAQVAIGTGNSLANDHPIGFVYDDAQTNDNNKKTGLRTKDNVLRGNPKSLTIADVLHKPGKTGPGIMTCASCHDVHNKDNATNQVGGADAASNYFVYSPQNGSQLCLSCHDK